MNIIRGSRRRPQSIEVKEWAPTTLPVAPGGGQVEDTPVDIPDIHYAWNGPVSLAYQVFGELPRPDRLAG
jgi:hypothetical protein